MKQLSLNEVTRAALLEFSEELARTELQVFKSRKQWSASDKLTAYFQSTPEKAAFSRLMYLAARVKQPYTVTEISNELGISRQTICTFTDDCCAEGWIVWQKVTGKSYKYMASSKLCERIVEYADYASDLFLQDPIYQAEQFLNTLKKRKAALRCADKSDHVPLHG